MKEKKQFYIPKNYQQGFEWIPGISGIQHLFFVPSIMASFVLFKYADFTMQNKVITAVVLLGIPYMLCAIKGARENIPLYKQLYWKIKFAQRQRKYYYKKEGYNHVEFIHEEPTKTNTIEATAETRGSRKEKHSTNVTYKGDKKWGASHSR